VLWDLLAIEFADMADHGQASGKKVTPYDL
jgi:hypothetical protein